jgi:predicted ATP-grasp superfamily ATP-dependent carboligase
MELNLRTGAQNMIATEAGINISLIRYMDLIGKPIESSKDYRNGVLWYDSVGDLMTYFMLRRRGQMTFGDLARSWLRADCGAFYAKDDVRPALARTEYGLNYLRILAMNIGKR